MRQRWAAAAEASCLEQRRAPRHEVVEVEHVPRSSSRRHRRRRPRPRHRGRCRAGVTARGPGRGGRSRRATACAPGPSGSQRGRPAPGRRRRSPLARGRPARRGRDRRSRQRAGARGRPSGVAVGRRPWRGRSRRDDARAPRADPVARAARRAALRVKVTTSVCSARADPSSTRLATRRVRTVVLPEPAPATTHRGAAVDVTARRCAAVRPCNRSDEPATCDVELGTEPTVSAGCVGPGDGRGSTTPGGSLPGCCGRSPGGRCTARRGETDPAQVLALHGWRRTHADFSASLGPSSPWAHCPRWPPTYPDSVPRRPRRGRGDRSSTPPPWRASSRTPGAAPAPAVVVGHSLGGRIAVRLGGGTARAGARPGPDRGAARRVPAGRPAAAAGLPAGAGPAPGACCCATGRWTRRASVTARPTTAPPTG